MGDFRSSGFGVEGSESLGPHGDFASSLSSCFRVQGFGFGEMLSS